MVVPTPQGHASYCLRNVVLTAAAQMPQKDFAYVG